MPTALIALGSNLGPSADTLGRAIQRLAAMSGVADVTASRLLRTEPIGGPARQPAYLNGAARLETSLGAAELHAALKQLEAELGRIPGECWGPRVIDLDLLLHGDEQIATATLRVPHPRMAVRRFVLEPAAEIAAELVHPEIGWSVGRLWEHLRTAPPRLRIVGADERARREVLDALVARGACRELSDAPARTPHDDWTIEHEGAGPFAGKLVIVLDDGGPASRKADQQARRPGRGPTLTVATNDPRRAIDEIAAALDAMRPPRE